MGGGASAIVAAGVDIVPAFVKQLPKGQTTTNTTNSNRNSKPPVKGPAGGGGMKGKNASLPINSQRARYLDAPNNRISMGSDVSNTKKGEMT